jgi:hypothetical protein
MVLDLIERRRPLADAAVLKFVTSEGFAGGDFTIGPSGVCRLAPRMCGDVAGL